MTFFEVCMKTIVDNVNEAVLIIDKNGKLVIINELAENLLGIDKEKSIGEHIEKVILETQLPRILKTGNIEVNEKFYSNSREFMVNRMPITIDGEITGAISIFNDITVYKKMQEEMVEDKMYIDVVNTIMNTFNEWVVVVDTEGIITMMSNAYKEFLNAENPEGRHVEEIIENTRMYEVVKSGNMEIGEVQEINGNRMVAMRIPIKKNGTVVGAIGKVMFKDISDFFSLSKKLNSLKKEVEYYKGELGKDRKARYSFDDLVGDSPKVVAIKKMAKKAAQTDSNVLIIGESGTGKELYAHAIHNASKRYLGPFVKINCGAIPAELLESELFGYEEGAFTGAKKAGKEGKFQIADGGTILLDEIGEMPLNMQVKLLRVLQEKEIERVGGNVVRNIDVRIIASTNKNLEESIKKGEFREDLYYRLNVMKLNLPPLRERKDDIPCLANALKIKVANRLGIYVEGISKEAIEYLISYEWPGNIRELENVIERAINLLDSDLYIKPEHLPQRLTQNKIKYYKNANRYLKDIVEEVEKDVIGECLKKTKGNKNQTAKMLGISRAGLYKKINDYGLEDA